MRSDVIALFFFFFFFDTAPTEIYSFSLHDALPIYTPGLRPYAMPLWVAPNCSTQVFIDRKSTRLNSSHLGISYAAFCLEKENDLPDTPPAAAVYLRPGGTRDHIGVV